MGLRVRGVRIDVKSSASCWSAVVVGRCCFWTGPVFVLFNTEQSVPFLANTIEEKSSMVVGRHK